MGALKVQGCHISNSTAIFHASRDIQNKLTGLDDSNAKYNEHLVMPLAAKEAENSDHNKCGMVFLVCCILLNQVFYSHSETFFLVLY